MPNVFPSAPNYDNVRMGGPGGIRIPQEAGKVTFEVQSYVTVSAAASTNITLNPAQSAASELVVVNATAATTINFPAATPGSLFVVFNNSGQTVTFKVLGQTGIAVLTGKRALLVCEATDIARVTADT